MSRDAQDSGETFEEAHGQLDDHLMETIEALTDAAASLKVFGEPDRAAIRTAIEASGQAVRALKQCLDILADEAQTAGAAGDLSESGADTLLSVVRRLEPPIAERAASGAVRARPGDVTRMGSSAEDVSEKRDDGDRDAGVLGGPPGGPPAEAAGDLRQTTAMAKLMAPYGMAVNLESDLYRDRIRRPYLVRAFKQCWGEVRFLGEREAGAGLVDRLQQLYGALEEALRGDGGQGIKSTHPWSISDRDGLAEIAERFEELSGLDDDEIDQRHRDDWLERVERWLETAEAEPEAVAHMTEMLTRFATDIPRLQDASVQTAAQRMMALDGVPDEIVTRLEEALND